MSKETDSYLQENLIIYYAHPVGDMLKLVTPMAKFAQHVGNNSAKYATHSSLEEMQLVYSTSEAQSASLPALRPDSRPPSST